MTKKNLLLIFCAMALAAIYVIWFTDWFRPTTLQIFHTSRNLRGTQRVIRGGAMPTLIFGVNHALRFNEIKVVPLDGFATNKNILPVWHLVSDSNSVPVKSFSYGQNVGGMRPAMKGVRAEPLATNVTYRLFVTSGKIKGEHDFALK